MNSFDLSLAMPTKPKGDVMASQKYDKKLDPDTGRPIEQTVTEAGVTINKDKAPAPMLDGPLGYKYTKLLDTELSLESMAAIAAAAGAAGVEDEVELPPGTPGFVAMGKTGPIIEDDTDAGYIYIVPADTLTDVDFGEIAQNFISKRAEAPDRPLGLAMLIQDKPSATLESLYKTLTPIGVRVTTMESGLISMIHAMKKGER